MILVALRVSGFEFLASSPKLGTSNIDINQTAATPVFKTGRLSLAHVLIFEIKAKKEREREREKLLSPPSNLASALQVCLLKLGRKC